MVEAQENNPVIPRTQRKQVNILIIGDHLVGKSSLVNAFCKPRNKDPIENTIGIDYQLKEYRNLLLNIYDCSGCPEYKSIRESFYVDIDLVLVVFDVTNIVSFENTQMWIEEFCKVSQKQCEIVVVGNKTDCIGKRKVTETEACIWTAMKDMEYYEVSAVSSIGIRNMFESIIEKFAG
ncbi:hypothetical protein SteCoe_18445 [Stentor coeruleus]|uniref:Uncharacterized protein n=1 Tax=Stentor coeruleus TaxID=5963 RepID=A0A1R2BWD8_9CILI|nr:hypothetical protein SteCoe_18445 [Stentor coeruleus]